MRQTLSWTLAAIFAANGLAMMLWLAWPRRVTR